MSGVEAWALLPAVRCCPLFTGMDEKETAQALSLLSARATGYVKGENIKRVYAPLSAFGLVLEGAVQAVMDDFDGRPMLMSHVEAGSTFGESLWYLGREGPVYIVAASACRVLWLRGDFLRGQADSALARTLSARFTAVLAERVLSMNDRIQILAKNSLRLKLIALLSQYEKRKGLAFTMPMDRARMAAYLGANRSALSRELSNMRREGILTFNRSRFTLLRHEEARGKQTD